MFRSEQEEITTVIGGAVLSLLDNLTEIKRKSLSGNVLLMLKADSEPMVMVTSLSVASLAIKKQKGAHAKARALSHYEIGHETNQQFQMI